VILPGGDPTINALRDCAGDNRRVGSDAWSRLIQAIRELSGVATGHRRGRETDHDPVIQPAAVRYRPRVELLRTQRLLLRHWEELIEVGWHLHPQHQGRGLATEAATAILAAAAKAGMEQVLALTDLDNSASQAVAARLGMRDEGITQRWFGLTSRQFRKVITACS